METIVIRFNGFDIGTHGLYDEVVVNRKMPKCGQSRRLAVPVFDPTKEFRFMGVAERD